MLASLNYTHYEWEKCPLAWKGQITDKDENRFIVLEAIANHELCF